MEVVTTKCSGCRQAEIIVRCDDLIPKPDVEWLMESLEGSVRDGKIYSDGDLIQIGWMSNLLSATSDARLVLREPDMRSIPIEWTDGVTQTLRHLRVQKDTAESLGFGRAMQFPTIRGSALFGVDVGRDADAFILERSAATGMDSGWFIGCLGSSMNYDNPGNLRRGALYEAAVRCPRIVMFMSLPFGTRVEYSERRVSVWLDGKPVAPGADSFLEQFVSLKSKGNRLC